ncbi:MAG: 50S ribosomal protein L6 [Candidatus Latescibacteria bacterium]|nr:50S ribosomal protein L6 [Candidatus Latescibacterota bacterium]
MSRVGKEPIAIPEGVDVTVDGQTVTVSGPKGTLSDVVPEPIEIIHSGDELQVQRPSDEPRDRSLHGLSRTMVANMVTGVTEGYTKILEFVGVGYRAELKKGNLLLNLGFSHPILVKAPEGVTFGVQPDGSITVSSINKYLVGQVAANIRALRPPEPYKGKGIRYRGEYVRRKAGKTGAAGIG